MEGEQLPTHGSVGEAELDVALHPAQQGLVVTEFDSQVESVLPGHEAEQALEGHLLDRLRSGPVELPGDVKPLGVGVDPEFDCFTGFGMIGL